MSIMPHNTLHTYVLMGLFAPSLSVTDVQTKYMHSWMQAVRMFGVKFYELNWLYVFLRAQVPLVEQAVNIPQAASSTWSRVQYAYLLTGAK